MTSHTREEEPKKTKEFYTEKGWSYSKPTPVLIDGKTRTVQMEQGMTGIGSRRTSIDGDRFSNCVTQSADLTVGNHFLYEINWRENPWDRVYIIISGEELPFLLDKEKQPEWRNPKKVNL